MLVTGPLIELVGVSHRLPGGRELLHDLDLEVCVGDRIAIMGPSGSGKSTLLAILGGLLSPTSGRVERFAPVVDKDIAWVMQQTSVLGYRSVRDNVALSLFARGMPWHEACRRSEPALVAAGLIDVSATKAASISGGERQRIGVARALAANCAVVLADEPTASLDATLVDAIARALVVGRMAHTAVVIATHDARVASACARVVQLRSGNLVEM